MVLVLAFIIIVSILVDSYGLLNIYGIYHLEITQHDNWLIGCVSVINLIKASIILFLMRYRPALNQFAILLKWFIVANIVLVTFVVLNGYLFDTLIDKLVFRFSSEAINTALIICLSVLVGISYGFIGLSLLDLKIPLNGYRIALATACIASCVSVILFFFETFGLLSLLLLDLSLLGFSISLLFSEKRLFHLRRGFSQKAFIGVLWVLPVSVYLVFSGYSFFKTTPFNLESLYGIKNTVFTDNANMKDVNAYFRDDKFIPETISRVSHEYIFMDVWFISNKEAYALDQGSLYKSIDGGDSWKEFHKLDVVGENIQFDRSGQYGWVGSKWGPVEITENYGKEWHVVNLVKIYKQLSGKQLPGKEVDDDTIETQSVLYLNPETKEGSFTKACTFFYTIDFAKNWQQVKLEKEDGKTLCLDDSPFALNKQQDLAVSMLLARKTIYRKQADTNQWKPICSLGSSEKLNDDADTTLDNKVGNCADFDLVKKEKDFISVYSDAERYLGGTGNHKYALDMLVNKKSYPVNQLKKPLLKATDTQWIAGEGVLLTTTDMGQRWHVKRYVPELTTVHPLSATTAIGWGDNLIPYMSRNHGKVWQQFLEIKKGERLSDIYFDSTGSVLWLLFTTKLQKVSIGSLNKNTLFEWNDNKYSDIGVSPDGARMWLFNKYDSKINISADKGNSWQEIKIELPFIDEKPDDYWLEIKHFYCNSDEQSCFLLTEDRGIYEIEYLQGKFVLQTSPVARLPEEVEDVEGYLYSGGNNNQFLYVEGYGRNAYLSKDRGQSWDKQALKFRENWSRPQLSENGKDIFILGNGKAVLTKNFGEKWAYIHPDGWEGSMRFCWDMKSDFIFIYDDSDFAASFDGGDNWVKNYYYKVDAPSCGIGGGYLWLKTYSMNVYKL